MAFDVPNMLFALPEMLMLAMCCNQSGACIKSTEPVNNLFDSFLDDGGGWTDLF
jgi:hypothetical protein